MSWCLSDQSDEEPRYATSAAQSMPRVLPGRGCECAHAPSPAPRRLRLRPGEWRAYKVAWIGGCVLFDRAKLVEAGGFDFWTELHADHLAPEGDHGTARPRDRPAPATR